MKQKLCRKLKIRPNNLQNSYKFNGRIAHIPLLMLVAAVLLTRLISSELFILFIVYWQAISK